MSPDAPAPAPAPSAPSVHEMFRAQAARTPDLVAVRDGDLEWTYAQLDQLSDGLAGELVRRGVGRDRSVGIFMPRSADYLLACMAALKAGGAYLPLDMSYPDGLLARVLAQTQSPVVLTRVAHAARLDGTAAGSVLALDGDPSWREAAPPDGVEVEPDDLAYVIYTSGTTGEPKGIEAPHRGAVHSYDARHLEQPYAPGQRVACNVFFVWEVFRPLARGASVDVIPDDVIYDPRRLTRFLHQRETTEVLFTPSLLETVLDTLPLEVLRERLAGLQVVYLNGEVVTTRLRDRALEVLPATTRLLNTYSISECHDVATLDLRTMPQVSSAFCPVGYPIAGVNLHLLDPEGQPVPDGDPGELFVGGPCLARGYLGRPDLTAARFVLHEGERLYRTGDVAVRHEDGWLEIRGRCDFMVKIRGYSVHLGAVEAALRRLPGVASAAVVTEGAEGEDKRLVAYLTRDQGGDWRVSPTTGASPGLRKQLAALLPDFMIPRVYVEIDRLPLGAAGKLDTRRLPPAPAREVDAAAAFHLPEGASESARRETMRAVWSRCLGLAPGDVHDGSDFFDLGGHSLMAVSLTSLVEQVFGAEVSVQQVYEHPTVASLVRFLDGPPACGPEHRVPRPAPLRADAELADDIRPASASPGPHLGEAEVLLLTGATGFLGAFLLDELLRTTDAEVRCLVRALDEQAARRRLHANLDRYGLRLEDREARVRVIVGDLAQPRMGLDEAAFSQLADEVDAVVHAAALVNYVYPYAKLKGATVDGTREVLRLACQGRPTSLVHVSTNGIVPEGAGLEVEETADIDGYVEKLAGGYGQAKWVAERLVWQAVERGLSAWVFRPGNIGHHSATGAANPSDLQYHLLEACRVLGVAPRRPEWAVELTPVDALARAVVTLARDPRLRGRVFHVVGQPAIPLSTISQGLRELGAIEGRLPPDRWAARLADEAEARGDPTLQLLSRCLDDLDRALTHGNHFRREGFLAACQAAGLAPPETGQEYLEVYLRRAVGSA